MPSLVCAFQSCFANHSWKRNLFYDVTALRLRRVKNKIKIIPSKKLCSDTVQSLFFSLNSCTFDILELAILSLSFSWLRCVPTFPWSPHPPAHQLPIPSSAPQNLYLPFTHSAPPNCLPGYPCCNDPAFLSYYPAYLVFWPLPALWNFGLPVPVPLFGPGYLLWLLASCWTLL